MQQKFIKSILVTYLKKKIVNSRKWNEPQQKTWFDIVSF